MLDSAILQQLRDIFGSLEANYTFAARFAPTHEKRGLLMEFLNDFASTSSHLSMSQSEVEGDGLEFSLLRDGQETGIIFRGIPNGHEFTSLILAVLNADGKGKNLPDEGIARRVRNLKGDIRLQTYISLTCTNCQIGRAHV